MSCGLLTFPLCFWLTLGAQWITTLQLNPMPQSPPSLPETWTSGNIREAQGAIIPLLD